MTFYYSEISKQTDAAELSLTFLSVWLTVKTIVPCFAGSLVKTNICLVGCRGPAPAGSRGCPQDERRWRERGDT